jgi:hypothetical protein
LIIARLDARSGPLFHAAGSEVAGDLAGTLAAAGFAIRRGVLYKARAAKALTGEVQALLAHNGLDAAMFFSPKTAGTFARLVESTGLRSACMRMTAYCLSGRVAERARMLPWAAVHVADRPSQHALVAILNATAVEASAKVTGGETVQDDKPAEASNLASDLSESPAQRVIVRFGGIRPMAAKLGLAVSTVQGWKERGVIPTVRHEHILAAAREHGVELDAAELRASDQPGERATPAHTETGELGRQVAPASDRPMKDPEELVEQAQNTEGSSGPAATTVVAGRAEREDEARESGDGPRRATGEPPAAATIQSTESTHRGKGWLPGFLLGALVFALGAGGAVVTRDLWDPNRSPAAGAVDPAQVDSLTGRIQALETVTSNIQPETLGALRQRLGQVEEQATSQGDRLSSLNNRIDQVAKASAAGPDPQLSDSIDRLEGNVTDTAARLNDLAKQLAGTGDVTTRLETVERRWSAIEQRISALDELERQVGSLAQADREAAASQDVALALAIGQLRDALRSSAPFQREMTALQAAVQEDRELRDVLAPLAQHASTGVPTADALRRDFSQVARRVASAGSGGDETGWLGGVMRRLSNIVTVRPVGEAAEGNDAGATVARAEARLEAGNLAGAVAALGGLQGPAAEAARPWLERARARLAAQRALSTLNARATARLSTADG